MTLKKPDIRPENSCFSSGPTSKYPGWSISELDTNSLGRSHRAKHPKSRLKLVIDQSKKLLGIPDDFLVGIVPASDTGAFEMAMWNMLGARGVDALAWESFGEGWLTDIRSELQIDNARYYSAEYGELPDLNEVDSVGRDLVFAWNGTTSGVCLADGDWISNNREGLTFCDATSALFAMEVPWEKLDVTTWSWQKVLGGEAAHGMIALSPRAAERLESYSPPWPVPKIFRLTKKGKIIEDIFEGGTINTPSMIAVEDQLKALEWAEQYGLQGLIKRARSNLEAVEHWVEQTPWVEFLARNSSNRSPTSICLSIVDQWFTQKPEKDQRAIIKNIVNELESQRVAYDIGAYRDAPPGFRVWGGGTVEKTDIEKLLPWIDWGYLTVKNEN
ncbi:MAG: phosphoserine transaminase [Gammaproteobacteria bacterium]|nr:phosphoserine transaminase [Gammaproteobacteria bacterium]